MTLEARREKCQEIFDKFKEDWRTRAELENIEITYNQGDVCFYYKGNLFSEVPIIAFESMFQGVINLRRLMLKELKEFLRTCEGGCKYGKNKTDDRRRIRSDNRTDN